MITAADFFGSISDQLQEVARRGLGKVLMARPTRRRRPPSVVSSRRFVCWRAIEPLPAASHPNRDQEVMMHVLSAARATRCGSLLQTGSIVLLVGGGEP